MPGRVSEATQELVFKAVNLPPLGFKSYYIQKIPGHVFLAKVSEGEERFTIGNKVRLSNNNNIYFFLN